MNILSATCKKGLLVDPFRLPSLAFEVTVRRDRDYLSRERPGTAWGASKGMVGAVGGEGRNRMK